MSPAKSVTSSVGGDVHDVRSDSGIGSSDVTYGIVLSQTWLRLTFPAAASASFALASALAALSFCLFIAYKNMRNRSPCNRRSNERQGD